MNKIVTTFAFALALTTTISSGNSLEDKSGTTPAHALPASPPAIESPSPQQTKPSKEQQYTPAQKATIVGLKLDSIRK